MFNVMYKTLVLMEEKLRNTKTFNVLTLHIFQSPNEAAVRAMRLQPVIFLLLAKQVSTDVAMLRFGEGVCLRKAIDFV